MTTRPRQLIWVVVLVIAAAACAGDTGDERVTNTTRISTQKPPNTLASQETARSAMDAAEEVMAAEAEAKNRRLDEDTAAAAVASATTAAALVTAAPQAEAAAASAAAFEASENEGFNRIGGSATVNDEPYDLTFFEHYGVNPFVDTEDDHLSTFAIDVDTGSYTVARFFVQDGHLPDPASVRVEEFVNYFDYGYEAPSEGAFAIHMEGSPSRFGTERHWLLRVGLQGKAIPEEERKDATLVFAIDVSGSMNRGDRLGLVKESLALLVDQLRPTDEVGIVIYGSRGQVLLEPTDGGEKQSITRAIDALQPGGSTYAEEGLRLAYQMAAERVQPGRVTRVLLLSDGVANVGVTGSDSILREIRSYVDQGVTLTTVGFGMGNFNDVLMEQLANDGDGTYHYVDTLREARRLFVDNLVGTLQNIARDTKVQVDFNPEVVRSWRLLGYENRAVRDEEFRDDTVDAGEVGAGHSVTALYEMKLFDEADGVLGTVYLRYEDSDTGEVHEIDRSFLRSELVADFEETSSSFQLAAVVAEYAEVLRQSYWAQDGSLSDVAAEAVRVLRLAPDDADVAEFAVLTAWAEEIAAATDAGPGCSPLECMQNLAVEFLADWLGVSSTKLEVVEAESRTWPDSSIGCPVEGYAYATALEPGYRFKVESESHPPLYVHTNEDGSVLLILDGDVGVDESVTLQASLGLDYPSGVACQLP
ncbi:MAG: von Willebrand factor type A domain-containing protein [bacterium]|nr:von Willebrand factor type A domain-containing protein [bacterium]